MALSDLTRLWVEAAFASDALKQVPDHVQIIFPPGPSIPPQGDGLSAEGILASSLITYNGALFATLPNVRIVVRTGIGLDNVVIEDATARGIVVCNTPDGPTESTAEHTVAMLLALAKRLKQGNDNLIAGKWGPRTGALMGIEVVGKTLGLLGLGRIGRRVAQICRNGFDMRVLAYDPYVTAEQAAQLGVTLTDLDSVIAQADFLSVHVPATPETYHLIDSKRIAQMKDGAYVLNMARGPLVDEHALIEAIDRGKLAGAGIDVFEPEPPPVTSRLRNHPLILATPHSASVTVEGRARIEFMAVERLLAFFRGERPQDVVNPAVLK
ncbi:MAG: NAD(P)-dependent oxidoreductase [Caldilineaceae bacterium]